MRLTNKLLFALLAPSVAFAWIIRGEVKAASGTDASIEVTAAKGKKEAMPTYHKPGGIMRSKVRPDPITLKVSKNLFLVFDALSNVWFSLMISLLKGRLLILANMKAFFSRGIFLLSIPARSNSPSPTSLSRPRMLQLPRPINAKQILRFFQNPSSPLLKDVSSM